MPPLRRHSSPCPGVSPPLLYFVNDEIKAPNYILLYKTLTEPLSIALWSTVQATSRAQKELYLDLQVRRPVCVTTIPCEEQQLSIQGYSTFKLANGIPEDLPSKTKKKKMVNSEQYWTLPVSWTIQLSGGVSKLFYDTSTGVAIGAVPLWFFCWRGTDRSGSWLSGNTVDTKIYVVRAAGA
jgi:hypothetical protein